MNALKIAFLFITLLINRAVFSQSLLLNADPQWISLGDIDVTGDQITVEALVYYTGGQNVVSKHTGPTNANYLLRLNSFQLTTTSAFYFTPNPYTMNSNTWYHIAGTYDGTNVKYYVNGCLISTVPATGNLITQDLATAIGNKSFNEGEQYFGQIDEVRIWNVARTQAQIQSYMNNLPTPATQPGLLAYYKFTNNLNNSQGNALSNGTSMGAATVYAPEPPIIVTTSLTAVTPQNALCTNNNGSVIITASGNNIQYSIDNVSYTSTSSFSGLAAGNYTAYVESPEGCKMQQAFTITLTPTPSLTLSSTPSPCFIGNATLTASGATNYTWSPSGTLSSSNGSLVTSNAISNTIYTVSGESNSCVNTKTIAVTRPANFTVTATSASVCAGNSVNLTASGATTYTWNSSTNLNTANATSVIATPNVTETYTVTGSVGSCTNIAVTTVTVIPNPTITLTPTLSSICPETSSTLTASGATNYTWTSSIALSNNTGSLVVANPTTTTVYTVTGSANSCTNTAIATVSVLTSPTLTITPSFSICSGSTGTLIASGASTYTWNNSTNLSSANGGTVTSTTNTNETYTVIGTALNTCTNSAETNISVNPLPTVTATSNTICTGTSGSLTANGATTYTWNNATTLNTPTGSSVTATPTITTIYTITGTDANNCVNTTTTSITVDSKPTLTVTPSFTMCSGTTGTLIASGANTYTWTNATNLSSANGDTVTSTTNTTETYTVIGTALNTCTNSAATNISVNPLPTVIATSNTLCVGSTASISASGAITYTWNPATTLTSATDATVAANPTVTTNYTVTATNINGCVNTTTTTITVNPLPTVTATSNTICTGTSGSLTANGATTYTWNNATTLNNSTGSSVIATPTITTTYTVSGSSALGCISNSTVSVDVVQTPTLTVGALPLTICSGSTSALSASGASSYTWSPSASLTNVNISNPFASPVTSTTYVVIGSNGTLPTVCTAFKTITIVVLPKVTPVVAPNDVICLGQNTTLFATGGNTYNWSPTNGVAHPNYSTTVVSPTATTVYTVTVSQNNLCPETGTVMVTVNPLPTVYAGKDSTINIDQEIVLSGTGNVDVGFLSPDGNPLICNWCPIVTVYPKKYTCYTLEGFNSFGCRNTDDVCITVTKDWDIFIPNAFTPNSDLDNEYFTPKGYGIETFNLTIYDRWGTLIFKENNTVLGWDGKLKGKLCEQGVYVYQAEIISMRGVTAYKTGHVTLLGRVK